MITTDQAADQARCPAGTAPFTLTPATTLADPAIRADPTGFYGALRREDPVRYDAKLGMYLVSRYEDVQRVLTDSACFSTEAGYREAYRKVFMDELEEILARDGGGYFPDLLMLDPPRHDRPRRLLEQAFTAHRVRSLEPRIRTICADIIERIADRGQADAVRDFAAPMTTSIICDQLGFDNIDGDTIRRWSLAGTSVVSSISSREEMLRFAKDMCEMQLYLLDRIRERRDAPREDMMSDLVHARIDDDANPTLSVGEVIALARPLLIAGHETTATALGNLFHLLATEPEQTAKLTQNIDNDRYVSRFVEEFLRYEPPVRGLFRMTTQEVQLGGRTVPAGAHLLLLFASANDDDGEFACPRSFDPDRPNLARHLSFGKGAHKCIGLSLARMEIKVAVREIINRLDNYALAIAPEAIEYLPTAATRSLVRLPITFSRRDRPAAADVA